MMMMNIIFYFLCLQTEAKCTRRIIQYTLIRRLLDRTFESRDVLLKQFFTEEPFYPRSDNNKHAIQYTKNCLLLRGHDFTKNGIFVTMNTLSQVRKLF